MAKHRINECGSVVLLGYEDEIVTDKHTSLLGYWTNKIGGMPDWPTDGVSSPNCDLCSLPQLLVTQIYASLEGSPYHRTLYVFCCINPNCWNMSESWTCRRCHIIDTENNDLTSPEPAKREWCAGADDWDDDNGNTLPPPPPTTTDSDDSSSLSTALGNLSFDQCNANWGAGNGSGAVGKMIASAEIEGDEGEVVSIDTPTAPQHDLLALLEATAPLPSLQTGVGFVSSFIQVLEEGGMVEASEHVRGLMDEYQARHGEIDKVVASTGHRNSDEEDEKYERALPPHGDAMFHEFVTRLNANPGHILRYSRGSSPLLIAPLEAPRTCRHCRGDLIFEMQILPTLLTTLHLPGDSETHVDFGNVLVFTCKNSCWTSGDFYRDEHVCVQMELAAPHRRN